METINVNSKSREEFIDITDYVIDFAKKYCGRDDGIIYIYVPHTTAAITINENADPSVTRDIVNFLNKLVPRSNLYTHLEGNSDAHIKSSLVGCSKEVFVEKGNLVLGTWQGIYFCEFDGPRNRQVYINFIKQS